MARFLTRPPFHLGISLVIVLWTTASLGGNDLRTVVVFGDSLSDTGNIFTVTGGVNPDPANPSLFYPDSPPYADGRFTNGPVWVEVAASQVALGGTDVYLTGGGNYAFGTAQSGPGVSSVGAPNLLSQIALYLSFNPPVNAETLYVLWAGGNDFINDPSVDPESIADHLATAVETLTIAGAERFLILTVPDLSRAPSFLDAPASVRVPLREGVEQANAAIAIQAQVLESALGVRIALLDAASELNAVLVDPASMGLSIVDVPAFDPTSGLVAPNPDEYLFWDGLHPTRVIHEHLGRLAVEALFEAGLIEFRALADLGDGWVESAWLGLFSRQNYPVIFHVQHGFLSIVVGDEDGMWLFHNAPQLGFVYTSRTLYPYLYSDARQSWLYFFEDTGIETGQIVFFDFGTGDFLTIAPGP